ncbi:MAG: hypothetical protein D6718_08545 [Acidobacteria bacterium]|nr:MAG: hypothetical protein D6718_08545 [Acidobacteriota bacterium]
MPLSRRVAPLVLAAVAVASLPAAAGEPDLTPLFEQFSSDEPGERVAALRALMRLKPPAEAARPLIEKAVQDPNLRVRTESIWAVQEVLGGKGTDLLEKLYKDPQRVVRDGAVHAACSMWDQARPRDLCRSAFDDPDFSVKLEVVTTLRENFPDDPEAAKIFRAALDDVSDLVRRAGVFGVQSARDRTAVPKLAELARTAPDMIAIPAAEAALATIGTPEAIDALIALLPKPKVEEGKRQRPSDLVRAAAARALARIKPKKAIPALRPLLADPSVPVRLGAMEALLQLGDVGSVPAIARQLEDPEPRIRRYALRALRRIGLPEDGPKAEQARRDALARVRAALHEDKDPIVRAAAASTLADLLGAEAIPDLVKAGQDLDASVRTEAAGALAGIGKPAAEALAAFVDDPSPEVRALAINGLGQIGDASQIPRLAEAAKDKDRRNLLVRGEVAEALGDIGSPEGIPVLEELASDPEPSVRQKVAASLGRIGGTKAMELLQRLTRDPVPRVRNAARKALEKAGGGSARRGG